MGGQTSIVLRHQELGIANAPFGKKLLNSYMGNICSILVVYDVIHSGNEAEFGSEIWNFFAKSLFDLENGILCLHKHS